MDPFYDGFLYSHNIFVVRPGKNVPADKAKGDPVSAATVNQAGFIRCEAAVKKALEAVSGVESAVVSHVAGTAVVIANGAADAALKDAVVAQGYEVLGIE